MNTVLTGNRASDKTYNLFANCEAQSIPIVVASKEKETELKEYAKRLGFNVQIFYICDEEFLKHYHIITL